MSTIRRDHRFVVTPEALLFDSRLSDRAARLWCILARSTDGVRPVAARRKSLAVDLKTSTRSIDRAMNELVEAGWLEKFVDESGTVSGYTLLEGESA